MSAANCDPSGRGSSSRPAAAPTFKEVQTLPSGLHPPMTADLPMALSSSSQDDRSNPPVSSGGRFGNSTLPSSSVDSSSVSSRCSLRIIHDTISNFGPEKVELVRSIGFDGLLHLPLLKQINLRFATWLMTRVDELSQTLLISEGIRIHFDKADVARVFGVPASGRSIFSKPVSSAQCESQSGTQEGSININLLRSLKASQAIVSRVYDRPMTIVQQDEFRAAFVVVIMATLLAPCAKHDRVCDDYMHSFAEPGQIQSYDWAEYVIRRLLDAVSKLKLDIANNVKVPYIYGCSLFLQVLYLDSVDLGVLSMPHNIFPRIRCFTSDRLRSMISAVFSLSANAGDIVDHRSTKLRDPSGICYKWASSQPSTSDGSNTAGMEALWDAVVLMTCILKIPVAAAGSLFVAAADFQRRKSPADGTEALNYMCVLLHIMEPFVNGFRYEPSINANAPPTDICDSGHPHGCRYSECCFHFSSIKLKRKFLMAHDENISTSSMGGIVNKRIHVSSSNAAPDIEMDSPLFPSGVSRPTPSFGLSPSGFFNAQEFDFMAINAMARFYLALRPVKATRCSDLNVVSKPDQLDDYESRICLPNTPVAPRSPWELGCSLNIDVAMAVDIRRKLTLIEDIDEPWIVHFCPKYIEVYTFAIKAQFAGQAEMEMELFDAVFRRFKQVDDELYSHQGPLRWRHFVELDFMVSLLAGRFDIWDPVLRSHFCGRHIRYDVTACEIVFFPVLLQYRWVCFAWRMRDNTIVVYDPCTLSRSLSSSQESYASVAKLLKSAMMLLASTLFHGWHNDWENARLEFFKPAVPTTRCLNQSGILCLHFSRCFDGERLSPPLGMGELQDWSAMLLDEVSALSGNFGSVPPMFL